MKLTYEVNEVISELGKPISVKLDPDYFVQANYKLNKIYAELQFMTKRYAPHNLPVGYNFYGFTLPAKFEGSLSNLYAKYNLYDARLSVSNVGDFRRVKVIREIEGSQDVKFFAATKKYALLLDQPAIIGDIVVINKIPRYVKYAKSVYIDMSGYWFAEIHTTLTQADLLPNIAHEPSSYDTQNIEALREELNALKNMFTELNTQLNILLSAGVAGPYPVVFAGLASFVNAMQTKLNSVSSNVNVEINKLVKEIR